MVDRLLAMGITPTSARPILAPLSRATLHLVIDMQRLFAEDTAWHTPALQEILPAVVRLAEARPGRTLFARFVPPDTPGEALGRWQAYYRRWESVTGTRIDPALLDLVAPLAALAGPGACIEKTTYSAFASPAFVAVIEARGIDTLVVSGVETDVCVLATVLGAVDRGLRVVVAEDAAASGSPDAHAAVLTHILPRLAEQVELAKVEAILAAWPA